MQLVITYFEICDFLRHKNPIHIHDKFELNVLLKSHNETVNPFTLCNIFNWNALHESIVNVAKCYVLFI